MLITRSPNKGAPAGTDLATRSHNLVAVGQLHLDGDAASETDLRMVIAAKVMRAGRGAIEIEMDAAGYLVGGGTVIWVVTTNKGWTHVRGTACAADGQPDRPFRADLYSAATVGDGGVDRFALRLYGPEDDPNIASPTHKIHGWLASGSIRRDR